MNDKDGQSNHGGFGDTDYGQGGEDSKYENGTFHDTKRREDGVKIFGSCFGRDHCSGYVRKDGHAGCQGGGEFRGTVEQGIISAAFKGSASTTSV
jgi:hypothetical protein